MKRKGVLKTSLVLITAMAILLFTMPLASADSGTWETKASMNTERGFFQTEVIDGKIYVIGGHDKSDYLSSVEEYDPLSNTWTTKASMATPRAEFQTEVIDGKIYAIGGGNSSSSDLSSVEEYDSTSNTWSTKASMATPRRDFQTAVVGGKIYAIGGYSTVTSDYYSSSVEEYDPISDTWTPKASMATGRQCFQTVVVDEKIYAIGGENDSEKFASVEEYNPTSNTWTTKASMAAARYNFTTEKINEKIYAIGGVVEKKNTSLVEEYDPSLNTWKTKAPLSTPRSCHQTEVLDGKIYAIGGCSFNGYVSSLEVYNPAEPSLTVTASSDKVTINNQFTTTIAVHHASNICAEDIKLNYDSKLFEFVSAEAKTGQQLYTTDTSNAGTVRLINASQGSANAATGDKDLITLTFKAKAIGTGKITIVKGRIADNATLEEDVDKANCGECSVTVETSKDVNRSGEVTLLDLGIDAGYYGQNASDTDSTKYDADVVPDGKIDGQDLEAIDQALLENNNYEPNK